MPRTALKRIRSHKTRSHRPAEREPKKASPTSTSSPILSQQAIGNQAVQRMLQAKFLQAKLTINPPDNEYEKEADQVADTVMRMPESQVGMPPSEPEKDDEEKKRLQTKPLPEQNQHLIQREETDKEDEEKILQTKRLSNKEALIQREEVSEDEERKNEDEETQIQTKSVLSQNTSTIQRKAEVEDEEVQGEGVVQAKEQLRQPLNVSPTSISPSIEAHLQSSQGKGQPLPGETRAFMEPRFGHNFGNVRIHEDSSAAEMNREFNAEAFTQGHDVFFGAGRYGPKSDEGKRLLAHELAHVVQQSSSLLLKPVSGKKVGKPKQKAGKPKPITFNLFKTKFNASVDAANNVTVTKVGKSDDGWVFTSAGPNNVKAERTLDHAEYVHAGGTTEPLVERCTITVPGGGPATLTPIVAELGSPPKLTIALSGGKNAAHRKSVTVNATTIEQLDLPATAITFTPNDGDVIHLALGGDAWVFTSLKSDPVAPAGTAADVKGFFRVGYFTRYNDRGVPTFGISTTSMSDAERKKAMDDLAEPTTPKSSRITSDEAEMFKTVSLIESGLAGVQTYDTGILSFGFSQWTVNADLPRLLLKADSATFERYLGRYGLAVGAPIRQQDAFVHRFVGLNRSRLGVRNTAEGALFLNGRELVNKRLLAMATTQSKVLATFTKIATDAKANIDATSPDLRSKVPAIRAAAVMATADAEKKIADLHKVMVGLAGVKKVIDPGAQADLLAKVATDGEAAANDLVANCDASEVMRGEEWALRFEMLGQSQGGKDAEIAEVRANWNDVSTKSTYGVGFMTLLPNLRGRAALLSSYLNTHAAASGIGRAVDIFKAKKQVEAKSMAAAALAAKKPPPTPTVEDWAAFPWKTGDTRWTTLWIPSIDEFEAIAIVEMTRPTTNPKRRRDIIRSQFP